MPKFEFDHWTDLYAKRTDALRSSAIRDLLAVTARSDIISLAGGLPYTKDFRVEKLVEAARLTMENEGDSALQYGPSDGLKELKLAIVGLMTDEKMKVDDEDLIITDGSQQALELLAKIFINPGDHVLVEAPSYVGALSAFVSYQPVLEAVPLDDDGLRVDLLEAKLDELKAKGVRPKFFYTVPNFHNPAGVTMSLKRRKQLIKLAKERRLLIVEDNPYGRLRFEGKALPSLKSMWDEVVYLSTFSKIFSPGVRLGWAAAPAPILEKLIFAKQAADLCTSNFIQHLVANFFKTNSLEEYVAGLVRTYRSRRDAMLEALEEFFPEETSWTWPKGGFFVWARLPEYMDTTEMLAEAIQEKVAYVPGRAFFPDGSGKNYMRLSFCYPTEQDIREGIRRLGTVIENQMELYRSLSTGVVD